MGGIAVCALLTLASLRGAHLEGADLRVARLKGAGLRGDYGDAEIVLPDGLTRPAHWPDAAQKEDEEGTAPAA
jgi:hypothetical protein